MEQQEVTTDQMISIIGIKEVELYFLRKQIAQLIKENAELKIKKK